MGKYASGLTTASICKLEVKECEKILSTYNVSAEDIEEITSMIKEGWYQAHNMACSGRALEKMVFKTGVYASGVGYLADYMKYEEEERLKVPWEEE